MELHRLGPCIPCEEFGPCSTGGSFRQKVTWSDLREHVEKGRGLQVIVCGGVTGKHSGITCHCLKSQVQGGRVHQHSAQRGSGTQAQLVPLRLRSGTGQPQKPQGPSVAQLFLWGKCGNCLRTRNSSFVLVLSSLGLDINYLPGCLEISPRMGFGHGGNCSSFFIQGNHGISWKWSLGAAPPPDRG